MSAAHVSYASLLRRHPTFRRIWLGDVVSLTGDWFTTISLLSMMLELTGKGEAVAAVLIARFLPALLFGPIAGVVADRVDRRTVLVACDVLRAIVVLGFLLVRAKGDVPLAYLLCFLQSSIAAFFDPAEQAAVSSVVERDDIVAANALQGVTWSAMLALGALAGGAVSQWLGRDAAFMLNAVTYLVSALCMASAAIPALPRRPAGPLTLRSVSGYDEIAEGVRFFAREPGVRRAILAKAGWGLAGGGAILLYSVFGERVFPSAKGAASVIGLLYAARGVGALLGPTVARWATDDSEPWLDRCIGLGFVALAVAYGLFGAAPWLWLAACAIVLAHMGASTLWSFSTSLLNLRVPDRLRGRAFAVDLAAQTVTMAASTWATGFALDHLGLSPRALMGVLSAVMLIPAVAWAVTPKHLGQTAPEAPGRTPKPEIVEPS
ncbi:MAG: MFS transporter [Myxococcales bacterium]